MSGSAAPLPPEGGLAMSVADTPDHGSRQMPPPSVRAGVPVSDVDPFSVEFFEDPHRIHGGSCARPGRWSG